METLSLFVRLPLNQRSSIIAFRLDINCSRFSDTKMNRRHESLISALLQQKQIVNVCRCNSQCTLREKNFTCEYWCDRTLLFIAITDRDQCEATVLLLPLEAFRPPAIYLVKLHPRLRIHKSFQEFLLALLFARNGPPSSVMLIFGRGGGALLVLGCDGVPGRPLDSQDQSKGSAGSNHDRFT